MNLNEVRSKIAKLLRLQTSNNAGEAANAAAFVEKLCVKYNVSSTDCEGYNPEKDEVVEFQIGKAYRKANVPVKNKIRALEPNFLISFKSMLIVKSARLVGSKYLEATK